MTAAALRRRRLCSGAAGKSRRPNDSFTRYSKSSVGSNPRSERRNPFWPPLLPWQPPELHPNFVKIGTTWCPKLMGGGAVNFSTASDTSAFTSPAVAVIVAVPSLSGDTRPR